MSNYHRLIRAFNENPIRKTYSTKRLMKQFSVTEEHIKEAKLMLKGLKVKGHPEAEKNITEFISLKQFGEALGMNMEKKEDKQVKVTLDFENATPLPNWVAKEKWVKSKEGSTHFINPDYVAPEDTNYKQEFQDFLDQYKTPNLPVYHVPNTGSKMAVVCIFDLHLGKIADLFYAGNISNPLISEDDYQTEFAKLYTWLNTQDIEEILLPIGNDFFNVDDTRLTTQAGTKQDNSQNLSGVFAMGLDLLCWTIDSLRQRWKVKVVLVPGNHAPTVESYLASSLRKIYEGVVEVDDRPISRKYFKYGKTLLGLAHGQLKLNRYAELLPYEAREIFSSCDYYEVLVGDKHIEEIYKKCTDEFEGVVVRRLAALTRTDLWHYNQGYSLSKRRSYVLVYDKEKGLTTQFINHV